MPQFTWERLQQHSTACEVWWLGSLGHQRSGLFSRDSQNRYKTIQADVISSSGKSSALEKLFFCLESGSPGTAQLFCHESCLAQHALCDNHTWSILSLHSNKYSQQQQSSAIQMSKARTRPATRQVSGALHEPLCFPKGKEGERLMGWEKTF